MSEPAVGRLRQLANVPPESGDGIFSALLGLAVRLGVAAWGSSRFPPAEDGHYYHVVATRIAEGHGYTWLWPDGAVTYAAHYPIGYPALVGALYAVFGPVPGAAMAASAALGALSVFAVHRIAATTASRLGALAAALAVALHPGLVLYTPALMTEGVAASLLAVAALSAIEVRARRWAWGALALAFGAATLVRPQLLVLAPIFGWLAAAGRPLQARAFAAAGVTAGALLVCAPWTLRNCRRMNACVLVSANAGWNLFIGAAPGATGTWVPLERLGVPAECRTVWGEAEKDECFGRAARRAIASTPGRWLSLVPAKLATTFDYAGAAGWYLHSSNPSAFDDHDKLRAGVAETVWQRLIVLGALVGAMRLSGPRRAVRRGVAAVSALALLTRGAYVAHLGLVAAILLAGRRVCDRGPQGYVAAALGSTLVTHAVFFGSGRYSLVCFPVISALLGPALGASFDTRDRPGEY